MTTIYLYSWKSEDSPAYMWGLVDGQGLSLKYPGRVLSMSWSCEYLQEQRLNNLFSLTNSKQEIIGQDGDVGLSCKTKCSGQPCNRLYKNSLGIAKNETIGRVNIDPQDRWIFYAKHSLSGDQCARKILCYFLFVIWNIFIICKINFASHRPRDQTRLCTQLQNSHVHGHGLKHIIGKGWILIS